MSLMEYQWVARALGPCQTHSIGGNLRLLQQLRQPDRMVRLYVEQQRHRYRGGICVNFELRPESYYCCTRPECVFAIGRMFWLLIPKIEFTPCWRSSTVEQAKIL